MALKKGAMLLAITAAPVMAHCAETTIQLTVGFELIGQKLAEQVYTEAGNAQIWRESDCRYLSLDSPAFTHQDADCASPSMALGVSVPKCCRLASLPLPGEAT